MPQLACRENRIYRFEPRSSALVLIDMQRDFCSKGGLGDVGGEDLSAVQAIVPRLERVLAAARGAGMAVCHTREGHPPDLSTLSEARRISSAQAGAEIGVAGPLGRFLVRGEHGHDFVDKLAPRPGEPVFDKPGFGAFYKTGLEAHLRERGVTHLVVTGVTSACCVQSTIREAVDRGFFVVALEDCCADYDRDLHQATFRILPAQGGLFGWVSRADEFLTALATADAGRAPL